MIVVLAALGLVIFWASYELANRLRVREERVERGQPIRNSGTSSTEPRKGGGTDVTWSVLDDHQLTRLLTQAGSRTATDSHDELKEH